MNRFIKNCLVITLGIIIVLFLLDGLYTKVYEATFTRNKTQHILSLKPGLKLDYVFLGSSRVENNIMPSVIEAVTNKKALNLGTQGARLDDMNLFLRLLIDKEVEIERLFVQVDYVFNSESSSDIVRSQVLAYMRSNTTVKNYMKNGDSNFYKNYYIPFYRYAKNDYRLGFREFFASAIKKKSKTDFGDGFVPLYGFLEEAKHKSANLPKTIINSNKNLIEIDSLCSANNINVTYFCAPFCSSLESNNYLSKLNTKLPNFKDYSKVIKADSLFQNCSHLNKDGALAFTKHIITALDL